LSKFFPKKRYGQNFLIDKSYVDKIVQIIDNESPRHVIEIGPGRGEITISLAKKVERVTAIEIDTDLVKLIEEKIKSADLNNIRLIRGDVLNLDLNDLIEDATIVVGNLPYNIATVIISRLEMLRYKIRKAILMVQKEVAERLVAVPGSKAYGSLSIFTQYNCRPKMLLLLKGTCFWPHVFGQGQRWILHLWSWIIYSHTPEGLWMRNCLDILQWRSSNIGEKRS